MPTIEQGHRPANRLPRSFVSRNNAAVTPEFKVQSKYERRTAARVYVLTTIGHLLFLLFTAGVIIVTIYVVVYADPNLIESVALFCLWFVWFLCFIFFVYVAIHCSCYTYQMCKYKKEKRRHQPLEVVATAPAVVTRGDSTVAKEHNSIVYNSQMNNHVNSMAGVFLGRQNSDEFRNIIISGQGLTPIDGIELPTVTVQTNTDDAMVYNAEYMHPQSLPIEIVIEGSSTATETPQIIDEPTTEIIQK